MFALVFIGFSVANFAGQRSSSRAGASAVNARRIRKLCHSSLSPSGSGLGIATFTVVRADLALLAKRASLPLLIVIPAQTEGAFQ
jgi:hypothetical protein